MLSGGDLCDPQIKRYSWVLLAAAVVYVYFMYKDSSAATRAYADSVQSWVLANLGIMGESLPTLWNYAIGFVRSTKFTTMENMKFLTSAAAFGWTSIDTTLTAMKNYSIFTYGVYAICVLLTTGKKVVTLTYNNPATAAAIAAVGVAAAAYVTGVPLGGGGGGWFGWGSSESSGGGDSSSESEEEW
jgi:hypothetical protein